MAESKDKEFNAGNPPHSLVSDVTQKTDQTVRLGLTVMPARYVLRGLFKTISDPATPDIFRRFTSNPVAEHIYADPLFKKLDEVLGRHKLDEIFLPEQLLKLKDPAVENSVKQDIVRAAINAKTPQGEALRRTIVDIRNILRPFDSSGEAYNLVEYAMVQGHESNPNGLAITNVSRDNIRSNLAEPVFEFLYDNALGVGSLAMTHFIRKRILGDMKNLYSEAVAYELDKDPAAVTRDDIFNSDNTLIQSTVHNFQEKQIFRLGISTIPFLKNIPSVRAMQFGEFGIGAWGLLWAYDTWGRESTMLEIFTEFVNDRLNPKYGIGDPIKPSDIINLYQNYAVKFRPHMAYKNVGSSELGDHVLWERSEGLFREIATLMNESYNYKHISRIDPKTGKPAEAENFRIPEFIYLLGHDMINIHKPEWSMAYIKIANDFGIKATKEVKQAELKGVPLTEVLKKYPVDPTRTTAAERAGHIVLDDARGVRDVNLMLRGETNGHVGHSVELRRKAIQKQKTPSPMVRLSHGVSHSPLLVPEHGVIADVNLKPTQTSSNQGVPKTIISAHDVVEEHMAKSSEQGLPSLVN